MRIVSAALLALTVAVAAAGSPFFLDRDGVLWRGTATADGLVLTGERDGETLVHTLVPFELGIAGTSDTAIQVAADETTGTVVVVWQRNWSEDLSEILLATWKNGSWDRIEHLTPDLSARPRNPVVHLSQVSSALPDPEDPEGTVTLAESFLHVAWWEGDDSSQGAGLAVLNLSAEDAADALLVHSLDDFLPIRVGCSPVPSPEILEYPRFAEPSARRQVAIFFGSTQTCQFHVLEVNFLPPNLLPGPDPEDPPDAVIQRRRHAIVFGVRGNLEKPPSVRMADARVILGESGAPVIYAVQDETLQYAIATAHGAWSPLRHVPIGDGLSPVDAVALVQRLAR